MPTLPTYRPSGRFGAGAWLWTLAAVPVALVTGWAYANAAASVAWKPGSVVVALIFWVVLLVLVSVLATRSRSRSPALNGWTAAALGFVVWWAHWVVLLKIRGGSPLAADFLQSGPLGWLDLLGRYNTTRHDGADWLAGAGWVLEALITIGLPAGVAMGNARDPYSETRGAWAKTVFKGELVAPGASSTSVASALEDQGTAAMLAMLAASSVVTESVAAEWWTLEVEGLAVADDPAAHWLNVTTLVQTRTGRGRVEVKRQPVVKAWHVAADDFEALRRHVSPADTAVASAGSAAAGRPADPPTPAELRPAVRAFERDDFGAAFAKAERLLDHEDEAVRVDATRMCAIAASRLSRWVVAYDHFLRLFATEATALNALQLATTSVCAGELARGQSWLERAREINSRSAEMPWPRIDTGFLSALGRHGDEAAALPLLGRLAGAYQALPSLDDHFVWSHGLPFFSEFLRLSLPLLQKALPAHEVGAWYARMRDGLDPEGVARLDAHLADLPAPRLH